MLNVAPEKGKLWTGAQVYGLALVCFSVGIIIGYLLRAPAPIPAPVVQTAEARASMGPGQQTPEQLKHMADKTAEPLLVELQRNPNDSELLGRIGDVYLAAQEYPTAQQYYQRSLAVNAADSVILTQLATTYYYMGEPDKAMTTLDHALEIDPKNANALYNLGMMQWQVKSDPKGAIALWEKLLKTNPHHPQRADVEQMIARARQHLNIPLGTKPD